MKVYILEKHALQAIGRLTTRLHFTSFYWFRLSIIGGLASKYVYNVVLYAYDILIDNAAGVWGR